MQSYELFSYNTTCFSV